VSAHRVSLLSILKRVASISAYDAYRVARVVLGPEFPLALQYLGALP
jgi:hypothetical protein